MFMIILCMIELLNKKKEKRKQAWLQFIFYASPGWTKKPALDIDTAKTFMVEIEISSMFLYN